MTARIRSISRFSLLLCGAGAALVCAPQAAFAQTGTAVVQPVPTEESERLKAALRQVARNPNDRGALVLAGRAALDAGDVNAARGFFTRADQLRPNDPDVKLGMAVVAVRSEDPFTALRLFDEVQATGRSTSQYSADRGLAYDLIGDNTTAQQFYREAIATKRTPELVRRLALSQVIGGDLRAAEATLLPLLEQQDLAAFRTRAFVLAIAGKRDEAMAIAEAVMSPAMARRLEPYLGYMARLTPAQQAAAGNFGHFPLASQIGKDDPRIAALNGGASAARPTQVARADDSRLVPRGEPLGQTTRRATRRATARPVDELPPVASSSQPTPAPTATPTPGPAETRSVGEIVATNLRELPPPTRADQVRGAQERADRTVAASNVQQVNAAVAEAEAQVAARAEPPVGPSINLLGEPIKAEEQAPATGSAPVVVAQMEETPAALPPSPPPTQPPAPPPASSLEAIREAQSTTPPVTEPAPPAQLAMAVPPVSPPPSVAESTVIPRSATIERLPAGETPDREGSAPASEPAADSASVAEAFAGFDLGQVSGRPAAGAVDITSIEIPREVEEAEEAPPPPPPPPKEPSRIWVQIATGQDKAALRFDFRRMSRKAPELFKDRKGFTAVWGQTNRLVTGPFDSNAEANKFVASLKEAEIDSFRFTSAEGEAVEPLP